MPRGKSGVQEVHFFKLDRLISDNDLETEYASRGLAPADPFALAAVNEADPAFADERPNCTHWKDKGGNWCYSAFNRFYDERDVDIDRFDFDWSDRWWFAGLRK